MIPFPDKKYQIIYADPPWQFNNKNTGGGLNSGSANKYDVMKIKDICALPINKITDTNCILFMWWVGAMPEEAIQVYKAWGFQIKNMNGHVWVKLTKTGKKYFGMGFWTRAGSESLLIATKGKIRPIVHNIRAVQEHINEGHSKKPNTFRELIVELMGDLPRIELFAREKTEGWDVWGNEV